MDITDKIIDGVDKYVVVTPQLPQEIYKIQHVGGHEWKKVFRKTGDTALGLTRDNQKYIVQFWKDLHMFLVAPYPLPRNYPIQDPVNEGYRIGKISVTANYVKFKKYLGVK